MNKYTVLIYPEPIEYEVEAENKEQAELVARRLYSFDDGGNEKVEVFEEDED